MLHSAWCAFGQYVLCTSLLLFPLSFTQQDISSNSPAWLDCAIHALPFSMLSPWMLLGIWSEILEISKEVWHSSACWKSGRREPCSVHACVKDVGAEVLCSALCWEAKHKSKPDTRLLLVKITPKKCCDRGSKCFAPLICMEKAKLLVLVSAD